MCVTTTIVSGGAAQIESLLKELDDLVVARNESIRSSIALICFLECSFIRRVTESATSRKQTLRKELRQRLHAIAPDKRAELSGRACERLLSQSIYASEKSILLYMPLQDELDISALLNGANSQGHRIALPRFLPESGKYGAFFVGDKPLQAGAFGVLEPALELPVPLNQLDLIVVPGLGFDARGWRLGRGKGFYDRILSEASGVKCGICFDEQIVEGIPVEPHDVAVDFLATPTRWLDCRGSTPEVK